MLSHDLENLACALEQIANQLTEENASFLALACVNLHSLADRVQSLEHMPLEQEAFLACA